MIDGIIATTDWQENIIIKDQGRQWVHQSLFSDRKSRLRIGEGMAAQRKRQEKVQWPNVRDLNISSRGKRLVVSNNNGC